MEAARSIREDFLHQNSFDDIDTYTSLRKQYMMMKLIMEFYYKAVDVLSKGASINDIITIPVKEDIGRFKYTHEDDIDQRYSQVMSQLEEEMQQLAEREV